MAIRNKRALIVFTLLAAALLLIAGRYFKPVTSAQQPAPAADASRAKPLKPSDMMGFGYTPEAAPGRLSGRITNAEGKPVAGAAVVASPVIVGREAWDHMRQMDVLASAQTNADGVYTIADVRPGVLNVTAAAAGYIPGKREPVTMIPGEQVDGVDLELAAGGILLSGRITDAGGLGIPGGRVAAVVIGNGEDESVTIVQALADQDGKYRISLSSSHHLLRASADGYDSVEDFIEAQSIDVSKNFTLQAAARIHGTVIDKASGTPVAGATVMFMFAAHKGGAWERQATSDARGRFSSPGLSPGEYRVTARKDALIGRLADVVVLHQTESADVTIEIDAGLSIAGHVLNKAGKPIANAELTLWSVAGPVKTKSDAAGAYVLAPLVPGKHFVQARARDCASATREALLEEGSLTGFDFALTVGGKLKGLLLDAAGHPLEGGMAQVVSGDIFNFRQSIFTEAKARTKADGRFEVDGLPAGKLVVFAFHAEHGQTSDDKQSLKEGQVLELTLKMGGDASVSGTVRYTDGTPAADVFVFAYSQAGMLNTKTKADGRFALEAVKPGEWTVVAQLKREYTGMGSGTQSVERVELAANEKKTEVSLTLKRANATIEGTVLDTQGKPLEGALVGLTSSQEARWGCNNAFQSSAKTTSDSLGRFRIDNVDEGFHGVCARWAGAADVAVTGVKGGTKDVLLRFEPPGEITGTVVDGSGKAVLARSVVAFRRQPEDIGAKFAPLKGSLQDMDEEASATFRLQGLRAGIYDVQATSSTGSKGIVASVEVAAGKVTKGIRVRLEDAAEVTGKVVSFEDGKPLAGVRVGRQVDGNLVTTDEAGLFRFKGAIAGGKMGIEFFSQDLANPRFETREVWVPAGAKTFDAGVVRLMKVGGPVGKGVTGLRVAHEGGRPVVTGIFEASAASDSGIKGRDYILGIDGKSVDDLGAQALTNMLSGPEGSSVTVRVQTGDERPREVVLERKPL